MDLYQLKTFVAVAREGSITRAAELLHLSQPAVSAHIKAIEDALGLLLFERAPRGMILTSDGQRLLAKAEQTLGAHRELMAEATRIKGQLTGKLRLGAGSNSNNEVMARLLPLLAARCPEVEVGLEHGNSLEVVTRICNGGLDAGVYNEGGEPDPALATIEVARFRIVVAARPGLIAAAQPPDWRALAELTWIFPTSSACCGRAAERLFKAHHFRPKRIVDVDREAASRSLIASGLGVGLLHAEAARAGEVEILHEAAAPVRVLFAYLASREQDPLLAAASSIVRESLGA
jgi:DNA-binding transcriptional LysR family regulator